jgi:hypothetical protein
MYYDIGREQLFANMNLITLCINFPWIAFLGWVLLKSNDQNRIDFKTQTFMECWIVVFCLLTIIGNTKDNLAIQSIGFGGLMLNQSYIIDFALLFRPTAESNSNAGAITAIYTSMSYLSALVAAELGGQLSSINLIYPFCYILLPVSLAFCIMTVINLVFFK